MVSRPLAAIIMVAFWGHVMLNHLYVIFILFVTAKFFLSPFNDPDRSWEILSCLKPIGSLTVMFKMQGAQSFTISRNVTQCTCYPPTPEFAKFWSLSNRFKKKVRVPNSPLHDRKKFKSSDWPLGLRGGQSPYFFEVGGGGGQSEDLTWIWFSYLES